MGFIDDPQRASIFVARTWQTVAGENLAKYVIIKAVDDYEVIYALQEIDPRVHIQHRSLNYPC